MYQGRVVEFIDHTDSLKETAVHPYTKDLFDSIPVKEPKMRRIGSQEKKIFSDNSKGVSREKTKIEVILLNEPQATLLITYLRNTEQVRRFKKNLVFEFYRMRDFIREKQTPAWQESRQTGITTRKKETDAIKRLCEYATAQGSKHPERLYTAYTKLANKAAGITNRTTATNLQLSVLTVAESIIAQTIDAGIEENKPYKEIYQDCKRKLAVLQGVGK